MTIIVGDELPLIREAIVQFCRAQLNCDVVAQCGTGMAVLDAISRFRPDIAVIELTFPDMDAIEILRRLGERNSRTRVVILSSRAERKGVMEALRAGAAGYILKTGPGEQLPEALRKVAQGEIYLSPQVEIGNLFAGRVRQKKGNLLEKQDPLDMLSGREYQVFTLLVTGIRGKEIATRLSLSPKTVDTYRASLMRKLDIHNLPDLVRLSIERESLETVSAQGAGG